MDDLHEKSVEDPVQATQMQKYGYQKSIPLSTNLSWLPVVFLSDSYSLSVVYFGFGTALPLYPPTFTGVVLEGEDA